MFDISSLATIAAYVIMALGLYWMGKANGVKYPWLSWFPIASDYALGLIAEKGASRGTNESKPYRKILMGLSIAAAALGVLAASVGVVFVLGFVADLAWDWQAIMNSPDAIVDWAEELLADSAALDALVEAFMSNISTLLVLVAVGLILAVVSVVYLVYYFICLWHVYNLYDANNAKLWTLITVLGQLIIPVFGALVAPIIVMVLSLTKKPYAEESSTPWENL